MMRQITIYDTTLRDGNQAEDVNLSLEDKIKIALKLDELGIAYLFISHDMAVVERISHRVAVMSAGVFDSLPHCGAIITLLSICKLTHKESYLNIAAMTIVIPLIALSVVIALGTMFGSF